jgi:hypothetical protein
LPGGYGLTSVADRNCVAARRGGEQREANIQSVGERTRFGRASWRASAFMVKPEVPQWSPLLVMGFGAIRSSGSGLGKTQTETQGTSFGGWRRNGWKVQSMKQGDLGGVSRLTPPPRSQSVHSSVEAG